MLLREKIIVLKIEVKRLDKTIEKKLVLSVIGLSCSKHDEFPLPPCSNQETLNFKESFLKLFQEGENKL
jgi:hypothetical protein